MKIIYVSTLLLILSVSSFGFGSFEISTSNDYTETIDADDLVLLFGGSDINSTHESAAGAVTLDVTGADYPYHVEVSRSDTNWPSGVTLLVRRTSDGAPGGNMLGGSNYQIVTTTDTYFFECTDPGGLGSKWGIGLQYQIQGISLTSVTAQNYSTTITYTVIDTQ